MDISPDAIIYWQKGFVTINATLVFTWLVMGILLLISWLATRNLSLEKKMSRWQNLMETLITFMRDQIKDVTNREAGSYLPFLGTLFLFISVSNFFSFVPGYQPPTGSLSTAAALSICVFFAVPIYGIAEKGVVAYLKHYIQPSVFMLPFNIIGEFSRTFALAVRLFGNVMSGTLVVGILLTVAPILLPVLMHILGLLIGQIQAYIFAVLATVYIGSATKIQYKEKEEE